MDLFLIDTAVFWMIHWIKILVDWTMFCVKITRLTQNLEISSAYRTGSCWFYCLKRGWLWTWFVFLVDKLATWRSFYKKSLLWFLLEKLFSLKKSGIYLNGGFLCFRWTWAVDHILKSFIQGIVLWIFLVKGMSVDTWNWFFPAGIFGSAWIFSLLFNCLHLDQSLL